MTDYYAEKLSGERLQRCYDVASPRVQQYLDSEVMHVLQHLGPEDSVLELGCGYGRITARLAGDARRVVGIDNAYESLRMTREFAGPGAHSAYALADALRLPFRDASFDTVVCVQNGICAFGVDQDSLLRETLRVTRPAGTVLLSTYSDRFWPERLAWFEAQAAEGLLGTIDRAASVDGTIVCHDGFRSGRLTPDELQLICSKAGVDCKIEEVDGSSCFCTIARPRI